jgi:hypothetical protein
MSRYSDALRAVDPKLGTPLFYNTFRIPSVPPADTNDAAPAGSLCWGTVGSLPNGELVTSDSFQVLDCTEQHAELKDTRKFDTIRITNPDDDQQWIDVDRAKTMYFNKTETTKGPKKNENLADPGDFGDFRFTPIQWSKFEPLGSEKSKRCRLTVSVQNGPTSA